MVFIGAGAEAKVYLEENVIKDRVAKSYRISEIDENLRFSRTRREEKVLIKLEKIDFNAPRVLPNKDKSKITMTFIEGLKLRDHLNEDNYKKICKEIGGMLLTLHKQDVIHGDLTTSNMIYKDELYFIDFGLSFISKRTEDKAVDLHLLKQALDSYHYQFSENAFKIILKEYSDEEVLDRLKIVDKRGRNKH